MFRVAKKLIPRKIWEFLSPIYHFALAFLAALIYGFPSKRIKIVAITGTKGKSTTVELVNSILEEAGYKTAVLGTIRFKIGDKSYPNLYKMTLPGRFFLQTFLRNAVRAKCEWAIVEMTSEGVKQHRHKFTCLDSLIFLNLSREHIESHGSYENYVMAKLKLAYALSQSTKKRKVLIANIDDKESPRFFGVPIKEKYGFSLKDGMPLHLRNDGMDLTFQSTKISSHLMGEFNAYNILAAATFALSFNIPINKIKDGIEKIKEVKGRVQFIKLKPNQKFDVVVDYAHTPDSLEKLYATFEGREKICVLGNTGGGRDTWKRPEMGTIADKYCEHIILTNEDPYDDDPVAILEDMAKGIKIKQAQIIMDRREAIKRALEIAASPRGLTSGVPEVKPLEKTIVLITGKGTDPFIMGPNGSKAPWSDEAVVREELAKILR